MDRALNVIGCSDELDAFLKEWSNESPAVTAHTSGSTGEPKEIRLLKTDMWESAKATCEFFGITEKSVLYLPLSVGYIAGKMMVVRALVSGAKLYVERPSNNPLHMLEPADSVTLLAVVPSQLPSLMANPFVERVSNVIVGGAPMSPSQETAVSAMSARVYASYGMTETCSHVALRNVSAGSNSYMALPDVRFSVDGRSCLGISCSRMSIGHLQTNDVVDLISDIEFRWLGRYDNVVNSGGIKLHPELLERKLATVVDTPFYLIGRASERWGQELVMVVEANDEPQKIMDKASGVLHPFEMPKQVFVIDELPRTSNGKIRRIVPDGPY